PDTHQVGHFDRCDTVIEPLISEQWFLKMTDLSRAAIEATEQGRVKWHSGRWTRVFLDWQRNLRDWCVSRQLWLGHRIPVYTCVNGHVTLAADGRRMSKSLGTGIDPREIIARYGADALRAWSSQVAMSSQDVRFDESRIEGYRRFANKLWNATRLVTTSIGDEPPANPEPD